jgi:hypothetical protein
MSLDPLKAAQIVAELVREQLAPLQRRIAELEAQLAALPAPGLRAAEVEHLVDGRLAAAISGRALAANVTALENAVDLQARAIEALGVRLNTLPQPIDGEDGKSVSLDDVRPVLAELVACLPQAKDGEPGRAPSAVELRAAVEEAIEPMIDRFALQFERRAQDVLIRAVAALPPPKDGTPGKDGRDGFDLKSFEVEQIDERTVELRFVAGELRYAQRLYFPVVLDAGPYRDQQTYRKGDATTFGGALWIAQRDTNERPKDVGSDAWRLAVRRGRDGKDGSPGPAGPPGPVGKGAPTPAPTLGIT